MALAIGASESSLFVAEEFTLQKSFGESRAVDGDEWLGSPGTVAVNGAGHQLLAGSSLARDQHGRARRSDSCDAFSYLANGRALAKDLRRSFQTDDRIFQQNVFTE